MKVDMKPETIVLPPARLQAARLHHQTVRADRAEKANAELLLGAAAAQLAASEARAQEFLNELNAELCEGGYEVCGPIDLTTGAVQRRAVTVDASLPQRLRDEVGAAPPGINAD